MKSNCIRLRKIATHRYENTSTTRTFHLHQGPKRDRSRPTTTGTLTWPGQHWAARNDRSDAELACPHFARSPSRKDLKHFGYSSAHMLTGTRKNWTICSSYGPRVLGGVHGWCPSQKNSCFRAFKTCMRLPLGDRTSLSEKALHIRSPHYWRSNSRSHARLLRRNFAGWEAKLRSNVEGPLSAARTRYVRVVRYSWCFVHSSTRSVCPCISTGCTRCIS